MPAVFPDPGRLLEYTPDELLEAAAQGHLGLDHRFLHALLDRPGASIPAVVDFATRDRGKDNVDLAPELIALFRHWKAPEGVPFLIRYLKEDPVDVPDEVIETLVEFGSASLEPLLALYQELDESDSGEVAFILANLRVRDDRILRLLKERMDYDLSDTLLLLDMYGDPKAIDAIEQAAGSLSDTEADLRREAVETAARLREPSPAEPGSEESFDLWALYPESAELPVDTLDEDERLQLLSYPLPSVRAAAAASFFNRELNREQRTQLLRLGQADEAPAVRARAWEALLDSTGESGVVEAMLAALRRPDLSVEERAGLLVGLSAETDRKEVRAAIVELYSQPQGRAKALEAMWRSMHPSFRDYFSKHLADPDLEVRRSAVWGAGYYRLTAELDKLRKLFDDEDLRSDAIFAYTLALPGDVSPGRVNGLLARVENDARGLTEMEEELVKAALDERLMMAGKDPVFQQQED